MTAERPAGSWLERMHRIDDSRAEDGPEIVPVSVSRQGVDDSPAAPGGSELGEREAEVSESLSLAELALDRLERLTNDLIRLKVRLASRRREVDEELAGEGRRGGGLRTWVYVAAISFLGLVEFFANAPVFNALLPRDPVTEQQLRIVTQSAQGWLAGAERVVAQLLMRPDAALLAAGVVTFLCVLAHFFGQSLRELVLNRDRRVHREAVAGGTSLESAVPMVLCGVGLVLVLGVLYEARVTLGEVGQSRYEQDVAAVEELRRTAGWTRTDGDLVAANEISNRAEDLSATADELREYAASMSRMSFPILLLNMTLVLCAISAAYFHRREPRRERFDERPFEEERRQLVEDGEATAREVTERLSQAAHHLRALKAALAAWPARAPAPDRYLAREPGEYEADRRRAAQRFEDVRKRFVSEAVAWRWEG